MPTFCPKRACAEAAMNRTEYKCWAAPGTAQLSALADTAAAAQPAPVSAASVSAVSAPANPGAPMATIATTDAAAPAAAAPTAAVERDTRVVTLARNRPISQITCPRRTNKSCSSFAKSSGISCTKWRERRSSAQRPRKLIFTGALTADVLSTTGNRTRTTFTTPGTRCRRSCAS